MSAQRDVNDQLEKILYRVWCAALDAQVMVREEGATEADYLRKQRSHFDQAKAEIRELITEEAAR